MLLSLPLVAWGAPDDLTAAPYINQAGTPIQTPGQADPFGGTAAVLVADDDGVVVERRGFNYVNKVTGEVIWIEFVKQGTSTGCGWIIRDTTAGGIDLVSWNLTWSTLLLTKLTGNGRAIGVVAIGGGWYVVMFSATGCVNGHTHQYMFAPTLITGNLQGSTYWYRRNAVLLDYLDEDKAWDEPAEGAAQVRSPTGLTDRWIPGGRRDYRFRARARWIPSAARSYPTVVSGWDGPNEFTGINVSLRSMLKGGQEGNDLLWVPDRSNCLQFITSELVKPWIDEPYDHEVNLGERSLQLELRNTSTVYPTLQ